MTERNIDWRNTPRHQWTSDQEAAYGLHLAEQRATWEQERRERKAQQERAAKQSALETHLRERSQEWIETTGEQPTRDEIGHWTRQYMDEQQLLKEVELAERRARAMELYPGGD
jgi:hypothetical protein